MSRHYQVHANFYKDYKKLRNEFVQAFEDPRETHAKRFVWDFWMDRDQYRFVRTPAYQYFSKNNYVHFHSYLVQWGRENLGCHDISPPWLSYYVDGCYQSLHSDVPHGPWAFVYSLTPNQHEFTGAETQILKPETLNYWKSFSDLKSYELPAIVDRIPSRMNQLVVFDPRYPHGVTELKGTRDPLKGRLVMHGWFVNPRPYVVGGLSTAAVQKALNPFFDYLNNLLSQIDLVHGTLSIRLLVDRSGVVKSLKFVTNTVLSLSEQAEVLYLERQIKKVLKGLKFPKARSESQMTLPLMFK